MGRKRGKRWNSCLVWFAASISALCLTLSCIGASDEGEPTIENARVDAEGHTFSFPREEVPVTSTCNTASDVFGADRLMLVSTLDGRVSALDLEADGQLLWSVAADSRPLLSSSISKLEIMDNGVATRYIPSLDGGLYKYDGESIEAVPMTAETLLTSSFKVADNTLMIGGKDILTYGLDPRTGQVRYACGLKGCHMFGDEIGSEDNVLVLTRETQTVRAVDARTGGEKWNFSVGEHNINFLKGQKHIAHSGSEEEDEDGVKVVSCPPDEEDDAMSLDTLTNSIKIVVPEGMVVGVNPETLQTVDWQHKFKSPISNAWVLYKGGMKKLDMFGNGNIPALSSFEPEEQPLHPPLLYVGMHQNQLYVQQSPQMQERLSDAADRHTNTPPSTCDLTELPRVAWKPYLNTAQWRTPTMNTHPHQITQEEGSDDTDPDKPQCPTSGALTIWHENYPFDNGFYLYPEFTVVVPTPGLHDDPPGDGNQSEQPESYILDDFLPVTLWNWWKEVVAISVLTSVVIHIILTRLQRAHANICADSNSNQSANSKSQSQDSEGSIKDVESPLPSRQNSDDYISRYASDFEHIQVLGKGGFGVVFETKNKVDECHYAVKRIALPNSDGAKEKVMREVKALAKLDHVGIVRYFHAWIESPPPGWQEERDQEIEDSECITSPTHSVTASHAITRSQLPHHKLLSPHSDYAPNSGIVNQHIESLGLKNNSPKNTPSPLDFLQNPFGGNGLDFSDTDAIKRGGSEEFSVQSGSQWNEDEEEDDESGSFSCGMGTPNLTIFPAEDSVEIEFRLSDSEFSKNPCSEKHIPFSMYNSSVSGIEQKEHNISMDYSDSSSQIVFEDSGCGDRGSKGSNDDICIGIDIQSDGLIHSASNSSNKKPRSRTHSRTHSRSLSRDLAKITYEKEVKKSCNDKKETATEVSRHSAEPKEMLYLFIQMQLCKRETLKDWLTFNTLNRDRHMVLDMFDQIVCAIEYVHDCGMMHRDLKPSNLFFSIDGVIKMGDFGLVTALAEEQNEAFYASSNYGDPGKKHTAQVGTQLYMSPEQTSGKVYSQKVDIFSLGVILFELLYPFATQMERVRTLIGVKEQKFPERFCREMHKEYTFVQWLLSLSPDDRPTAADILSSELLKEFENRRMPRRFRTRTVSQNSS